MGGAQQLNRSLVALIYAPILCVGCHHGGQAEILEINTIQGLIDLGPYIASLVTLNNRLTEGLQSNKIAIEPTNQSFPRFCFI